MNTSCPDEARLAAIADASLPAADREALIRHVADCDSCVATLGMLARMRGASPDSAVPASLIARGQRIARHRRTWTLPAVAAAVLIAASTALLYPLARRQPSAIPSIPSLERTSAPVVPDRVNVIAPAENGPMPDEVRWEPIDHAIWYQLTITRDDGSLVWQARTDAAACPVNPGLEPGHAYFVLVKAFLPGGHAVTSRAVRTVVRQR